METIQYRGAYRFVDRATLDTALALALGEYVGWKPQFSPLDSSLCVLLDLPVMETEQRRAADHVMEMLADLALEGIVVARHRELAVDVFMRSPA